MNCFAGDVPISNIVLTRKTTTLVVCSNPWKDPYLRFPDKQPQSLRQKHCDIVEVQGEVCGGWLGVQLVSSVWLLFLYTDYQQSMFVFFYPGPQPFSNLNKVILLFFVVTWVVRRVLTNMRSSSLAEADHRVRICNILLPLKNLTDVCCCCPSCTQQANPTRLSSHWPAFARWEERCHMTKARPVVGAPFLSLH